jgi:type II secretory ATPase GspE/PulE/Tfp pilus assembly ATPase PilB-like protein
VPSIFRASREKHDRDTITLTKSLVATVAREANSNDLYKAALKDGTETLCLHSVEILIAGIISLEEVRRVTRDLLN